MTKHIFAELDSTGFNCTEIVSGVILGFSCRSLSWSCQQLVILVWHDIYYLNILVTR